MLRMAQKAQQDGEIHLTRSVFRDGDSRWAHWRRRTRQVLARDCRHDPLSLAVDCFLIALICISVVGIVLESINSLYVQYKPIFDALEVFTVAVFTIEYLLRIWSCADRSSAARHAMSDIAVRWQYIRSPSAIIDLVAILPFYLTGFGIIASSDLRFLRALRLLRILKLTRYSSAFDTLAFALKENVRAFAAAFFVLVVVMLIAATGMYYFERDAQPAVFSSIPASMWWAFATLSTVGYGDMVPITAGGKVFGAVIAVAGIGMVALPTGILASAFSEQMRQRTERYQMESDNAWRDGQLTDAEASDLELLREKLGLSKHTASQILDAERVRAMLRDNPNDQRCPTCGRES